MSGVGLGLARGSTLDHFVSTANGSIFDPRFRCQRTTFEPFFAPHSVLCATPFFRGPRTIFDPSAPFLSEAHEQIFDHRAPKSTNNPQPFFRGSTNHLRPYFPEDRDHYSPAPPFPTSTESTNTIRPNICHGLGESGSTICRGRRKATSATFLGPRKHGSNKPFVRLGKIASNHVR